MPTRKSRQRETILRVVMNTTCHPGADWVYQQVKAEIPGISLGTIYRNLKLLAQQGLIREMEGPGGLSRFDGNPSPHYHFRCGQCRRLYDLPQVVDPPDEKQVARRTGFLVTGHFLEFTGICPACRQSPDGSV